MFNRATQLDPGNGSAFKYSGQLLQKLGRFDEAVTALSKAAKLQYSSCKRITAPASETRRFKHEVLLNLAHAHASAQRDDSLQEAIRAYEKAATIMPLPDLDEQCYTQMLASVGEEERALVGWRGIIKKNPRHKVAHFAVGGLLLRAGDLEGARRACTQGLKFHPAAKDGLELSRTLDASAKSAAMHQTPKHEDREQEICPICMEGLCRPLTMACSHRFCSDCVESLRSHGVDEEVPYLEGW